MTAPRFKCAYCGRFVSWGAESFTPFGGATDLDPPDAEYICKRCVRREHQAAVRQRRLPTHWLKAPWEYRAAKKLGFVQAGPRGAAWSHWFAPNEIPAGYEVVSTSQGDA